MTTTFPPDHVTVAVEALHVRMSQTAGPIGLSRILSEQRLLPPIELPDLTLALVFDYLERENYPLPELGEDEELAGFLYVVGSIGIIFVNANQENPIGRRRFTVAHELGHFLLHRTRMTAGQWIGDTNATIQEAGDSEVAEMEREANRFAAELLMPAAVCRERATVFRTQFGAVPNSVLIHRLAADLLVSRQAMEFRLGELEDRPWTK